MTITLRDYQTQLIARARDSLLSGKRAPLLVSPCGSGKTVMFSYFAQSASSRGKRVLILAHRRELLDQISDTLHKFNVLHGFFAAGRPRNPEALVNVGSVASVIRMLSTMPSPDLIIIDEAHHCVDKNSWGKTLAHFPLAFVLGVTASPVRLSGEALGDVFDDMILGPSVTDLITRGALSSYKLYAPRAVIDTSAVGTVAGEFNQRQLAVAADTPAITGNAVAEYMAKASGKQAVAFCTSVAHAEHVAHEFKSRGFTAACLDGNLPRAERIRIVSDYRAGIIKVVTSCDLISEGFDLPAIEVAIMLRPTKSLGLWIQQSGRALRIHPGKSHAIILDHAGNFKVHGLPDQEHAWSLHGEGKQKSDAIPVKECPACFMVVPSATITCPGCGHEWTPASKPRELSQAEGTLEEVDIEAARAALKAEIAQAKTYEDLRVLGKQKGYKAGWAYHVYQARQRKQTKVV